MTATGYAAANVGYTATAGHESAAVATWVYAACCDSYWGSTATAFTLDRPAYHHFYDSSFIAQWASESGTASYSVCFTYRASVLVVCFACDNLGSSLHFHCYGFHSASELLGASV